MKRLPLKWFNTRANFSILKVLGGLSLFSRLCLLSAKTLLNFGLVSMSYLELFILGRCISLLGWTWTTHSIAIFWPF
ncbi:hypothetical protein DFH08DRAFT_854964 [Mycena albidolilacea]|uniref:Uncharacterized protein n=1 Tax=Mycena albidolilacea TaxID=1033008 RepID=A0AAD7ABZ8_9AGAR|nr:hypothetical protein DFH08DRAFT_854964 [Mycena albidolilacea]